jgi:DNA-binding CsgD family transcriptional regulator
MVAGWGLIGRQDAYPLVEAVLGAPAACALVVRGPAGIGKSRLVEEAITHRAPDAWRIRASAPLRTMPLGALALAAPAAVSGAGDRRTLVQAAIAAVEAAPPPALWIDDAHHLDQETGAVVLNLVERAILPVVLTVRDGEALTSTVRMLVDSAQTLELGPLDEHAVAALAETILGGPLAEPSLRRIHQRCGGNPLLLRELLRSGQANGDVAERGGLWHVATHPASPAGLEDLVADHALGVSPPAFELFEHIAVADHLSAAAAAKLVSEEAIAELIEAGLVRALDDPAVLRPDHPLYAEVMAARLLPDDRRRIVERLAEAVESADGADEEVRAVRWRLEAGSPIDPERAGAAAWAALAVFDLDLTMAAAAAAMDGGYERASLPMATSLAYTGRHEEAVPYFDRAVAAAFGEWDQAFAQLTSTLNRAYWKGWGSWVAEAHRATRSSMTEPMIVTLLHSEEASALAFSGQLDDAIALAGPYVLDPQVDPTEALPYVPGWASARTAQGATAEVIDALARLEATVVDAPLRAHAWLFAFRAQAEVLHGNLAAAERAMGSFDEMAAFAMVEDVAAVLSSEMRGIVALERGDIAGALRWLGEAVALSEVPESRFRRVVPWGFLTQARALAGDVPGAHAAAEETRRAAELFPMGAGYAGRAEAWARAAAGDLTGAGRTATSAALWAASRDVQTIALWCAHDALRFAPSTAAAARVIELAERVDGAWSAAFATHAGAVQASDPQGLLTAADAFEAIGARLHAAEVLEIAAKRLRVEGVRGGARRTADRAAELRAGCGAAVLAGAAHGEDIAVASLTAREREAAALAAAGHPNVEIAHRLGLSVRTTEGHLAKAMAKLDVSRRTELAARLADAGATTPPPTPRDA